MNWKILLAAFIFGAAASYGVTHWRDNAQIVALQQHADSVARDAAAQTAAVLVTHDSLAKVVAQRDTAEQYAKDVADWANKRVSIFHDALHKALDGNTVALAQLDSMTVAHNTEVTQLNNAVAEADAKVSSLQTENRNLLGTVATLNGQVQDLNQKIQTLNNKTLPKWLDLGLNIVEKGLAVKGAIDTFRGH